MHLRNAREYASRKNPERVCCGMKISKYGVNSIAGVKKYEDDIVQVKRSNDVNALTSEMEVVIKEMLHKKTKRKLVFGKNKASNTEKRLLLGKF